MKYAFTIFLSVFFLLSQAQENTADDKEANDGFSMGMQLNQYHRDFGIGAQITSPFFAKDLFAFRLKGNYQFFEHIDSDTASSSFGEMTWTPYSNITFGLVINGGLMKNVVKLYAESGLIAVFPSNAFSSQSSEIGGYGVFGFEFFMDQANSYFIDIGGIGTGASADKIATNPIYSNGFLISAGYRLTL